MVNHDDTEHLDDPYVAFPLSLRKVSELLIIGKLSLTTDEPETSGIDLTFKILNYLEFAQMRAETIFFYKSSDPASH